MRTEYRKLVRDRIPEIIHNDGLTCETTVLDHEEYRSTLRTKLVEEARESAESDPVHLVNELADLFEVIDALMAGYSIDPGTVRAAQSQRHADRGGFAGHIHLLWTE